LFLRGLERLERSIQAIFHDARPTMSFWRTIAPAAAAVACIGAASPCWASFEFATPQWDSASAFLDVARKALGRERVVLDARLDWSLLTEKDAVLFLHPTSAIDATEASSFVSAGGRLAVVDDFGRGDELLRRFHIERAPAPLPPDGAHNDNPRLAFARPVESEAASGKKLKHPIVADLDHVVTNHPTAFSTAQGVELTPVLTLGDTSGNRQLFAAIGVIGDGHECGLEDGVPKSGSARCGRLFAMADSSVFIDLMMRFEGNRALARGLVEYLVESDAWGQREGRLFVVTNSFDQAGHFGDKNDFTHELDRVMDNLASLLDETREEGLPERALWLLALLAVGGTSVFAWQSSGKLYRRPMPRYARPQPLSAQPGAAGRASVLSAPTTHATLVLVELKAAAEEFLRARLNLPKTASSHAILEAASHEQALDPSALDELTALFERLERAEKALLGSENLRIPSESIKQVHERLADLLPRVRARR
jgi:hypothetical protein